MNKKLELGITGVSAWQEINKYIAEIAVIDNNNQV